MKNNKIKINYELTKEEFESISKELESIKKILNRKENKTMNDKLKLKPCPFCGKAEALRCVRASEVDNEVAQDDIAVICDFNHGGCGSCSGYRPTKKEAIELWNTREKNEEKTKESSEEKSCFDRVDKKERYCYIGNNGQINVIQDCCDFFDDDLYNIANYCTDKNLLQQQAYRETLNRLLWRFSMQNGGDKIDWGDEGQQKYYIYYQHISNTYRIKFDFMYKCRAVGIVFFISNKVAQRAIDEIIKPFCKNHPDFKF